MKLNLGSFFFLIGRLFAYVFPYGWTQGTVFTKLKRKIRIGRISTSFKHFGENSDIASPVTLKGAKYISIGCNTHIAKHGVVTAWEEYQGTRFNPQVIVGDNVNIGEYCHITAINKIVIGNGVLTGRWVTITDNSHGNAAMESIKLSPIKRPLCSSGPVIIEDNVWIGDKVTILPSIRIGRNSIIGANAVVTKDVPENSVMGGIPAEVIRTIN